jgi:hypothetical protein
MRGGGRERGMSLAAWYSHYSLLDTHPFPPSLPPAPLPSHARGGPSALFPSSSHRFSGPCRSQGEGGREGGREGGGVDGCVGEIGEGEARDPRFGGGVWGGGGGAGREGGRRGHNVG